MEPNPQPQHLKRLANVFTDNPIYFITCCCANRSAVLDRPDVPEILFDEWQKSRERHGWHIGRYVIMPDHVHFLASPDPGAKTLSRFMQAWKQWTSKRVTARFSIGPLWQKGFFDHLLRSDESLSEKWEYIRNNPVRANLVSDSSDWEHQGYVDFQ